MKKSIQYLLIGLVCVLAAAAHAQGTAFTYQGQLSASNALAAGSYNFTFTLFATNTSGTAVAGPLTNDSVNVTNGLFTVVTDFGSNVFTGTNYWMEIGVESNGASSFTTLTPRQQLTPVPYAIFAAAASNLSGTLPASQLTGQVANSQLASNAVTIGAGPGLSGGGTIMLGGSNGLNNAGVLSVTGNSDITATPSTGAVMLGDTATNTDTAHTIVKRDGIGSFQANNVSLDGALYLPTTSYVYAGTNTVVYADIGNNFYGGLQTGTLAPGGIQNTALGAQALANNKAAGENVAVGYQALFTDTAAAANFNTAVGYLALFANTSGDNTACGAFGLSANGTGAENTATGYRALNDNIAGNNNTADGAFALALSLTSQNTAVGEDALSQDVNGPNNTAVGFDALAMCVNGGANVAVGSGAGSQITGSANIDIGAGVTGDNGESDIIRIGNIQTNTYVAGIWNEPVPNPAMNVYVNANGLLGTLPSAARYKTNIINMGDASDVLLALHPVKFRYKPQFDPSGTPQFGLVAEEVEKVDPELVVQDKNGIYGVRYDAVNAMLLNEFLKQHETVEEQTAEIQDLKQSVAELKKMVQTLSETK